MERNVTNCMTIRGKVNEQWVTLNYIAKMSSKNGVYACVLYT